MICALARTAMALAVVLALWPTPSNGQGTPTPEPVGTSQEAQEHAGHPGDQAKPKPKPKENETPQEAGVPPLTDADRATAFPDVEGHAVHDRALHSFVLFDQLEWQAVESGTGASWDNKGWVGGDRKRFVFRTEGDGGNGRVETAQAHALFGRAIAPWWDLVVGLRQDLRPGRAQTWAAIGIQGLAPYWFEVEATVYIGASGRTHARLETEYELLLTNRLILQPLVEVEVYGKSDPERRIGAGLSTMSSGIRLRYEIRREFAPYVGLTWSREFFGTADLAKAADESVGGPRLALGVRLWF